MSDVPSPPPGPDSDPIWPGPGGADAPPPPPPPPPGGYAPPPPPGGGYAPPPPGGGYAPPPYGTPSGYSAPGYGAPVEGQLAEWPQRFLAYLVDLAIGLAIFAVGYIASLILGAIATALGVLTYLATAGVVLAFNIIQWVKQGNTGQTIGKKVIGLRLISETTRQNVGPGPSVIRGLAHIVDAIPCYIGFLWPLWDPKKQTFADKIMGTVVVIGPKSPFNVEDIYTTT